MSGSTTSPEVVAAQPRERISFGKLLAWSSSHASQAANFLILGYLTIYCTDTLGLNPAVVGTLLFVSKILDAVGALVAGYVVDRSPNTRWGKARPFDLAIIGIWAFTAVAFATPGGLPDIVKYVWVFVSFFFITAVFTPLFSSNQPLYLARVFGTRDGYAKASARSGVVIGVAAIVVAIVFPIGAQQAGKSPEGWALLGLAFAVPLLLLGLVRFFTVKEKFETEVPGATKITFADIRKVLATNPYLWSVAGIQLVVAIVGNVGAGTYYFRYIVGNLALVGLLAGLNVLILPVMIAAPALIRRFSVSRLIAVSSLLGAVGFMIYTFAGSNLILIAIGGVLANLGATPIAFLLPILIVDNASFNEWKGNRRLESVGGGVTSFAAQVGAGVAAALSGIVLAASGYDGTATTQSASAITGIIALMSWIPAGLSVISAVLAFFYHRMERELPAITASIELRREQTAAAAVAAVPGVASTPGEPSQTITSIDLGTDDKR